METLKNDTNLFTDIELLYREEKGYYDLAITGTGDLKADNSFDTGVNLALFTDGRADKSEVSNPEDQRGTIVDMFTNGYRNGSKLWLLEQSRLDAGAVNRAIDYAKNALKYFVDLSLVQKISVDGYLTSKGVVLVIVIKGLNGTIDKYKYEAWSNSIYKQQ